MPPWNRFGVTGDHPGDETDGTYAHWFDESNNPLTMIVAKDGMEAETRQTAVTPGGTTVEDFTLSKSALLILRERCTGSGAGSFPDPVYPTIVSAL